VTRRSKQIGLVTALLAMIIFGTWPFWKVLYLKTASPTLTERTKTLVEAQPQLKPMWDDAMEDELLTRTEAIEIVERGGEKVGEDE
jgi:hypothetical protein